MFWLKRTLQRRVVGESLWNQLQLRREELREFGLDESFVSHDDILQAVTKEKKNRSQELLLKSVKEKKQTLLQFSNKKEPIPMKVLPIVSECSDHINLGSYSSVDEAWRVTSDSLLASIYVRNQMASTKVDTSISMADELDRVSLEMRQGRLRDDEIESIYKSIVVTYGYKFAHFVFGLSHIAYFIRTKEENKTMERYNKAYKEGKHIPRDNSQIQEVINGVVNENETLTSLVLRSKTKASVLLRLSNGGCHVGETHRRNQSETQKETQKETAISKAGVTSVVEIKSRNGIDFEVVL